MTPAGVVCGRTSAPRAAPGIAVRAPTVARVRASAAAPRARGRGPGPCARHRAGCLTPPGGLTIITCSMPMTMEVARLAVVSLTALILSIAVHEYAHAWVADKLGDSTARLQGRVTLNPMAHADAYGTLLFPLISIWMT